MIACLCRSKKSSHTTATMKRKHPQQRWIQNMLTMASMKARKKWLAIACSKRTHNNWCIKGPWSFSAFKWHKVQCRGGGRKYHAISKTVERQGAVVEAMVSQSCVSSRTTLYDIIQNEEWGMDESSITHAKSTQGTTLVWLGYQGSYVRYNIRHSVLWKGSIVLSLIPVRFTDTIWYCGVSLSPGSVVLKSGWFCFVLPVVALIYGAGKMF